jgi:hypothetical protein
VLAEGQTTYIRKLRIASNERDRLALQLRQANRISAMSLQPPGMPEHAILCIRSLRDPYQQQGNAIQSSYNWEQAVSATLKHLLEHAARPAQGESPASADAVLFADRSEMLACLASDWCAGKLYQCWWWQSMFREQDLENALICDWLDKPEYIPGTLQHLATQEMVIPCLRRLPSTIVSALQEGVLRSFALHTLQAALSTSTVFKNDYKTDLPSSISPIPVPPAALPLQNSSSNISVQTLYEMRGTHNDAPWQEWVPECKAAELQAEQKLLLCISLMLVRAPTIVRSASFARAVRQWQQRELPTPATTGLEQPSSVNDFSRNNTPVPTITAQPQSAHRRGDQKQDHVEPPAPFKLSNRETAGTQSIQDDGQQSNENNSSYSNEDSSTHLPYVKQSASATLPVTMDDVVKPDRNSISQTEKATITWAERETVGQAERAVEDKNTSPFIPAASPTIPASHTRPHISFQYGKTTYVNAATPAREDFNQQSNEQPQSTSTETMEDDRDAENPGMLNKRENSQSAVQHRQIHDLAQMPYAHNASHQLPAIAPDLPEIQAPSIATVMEGIAGRGLETQFGGLFYLINVGLYLELYGDFTTPAQPGIPLTIWDFLALLGYRLLGAGIQGDPVWGFLALLVGKNEQEPPGTYFEPVAAWRVPVLWLKPFPGENSWQWEATHERLKVYHPAGFLILDVPLEGDNKAQLEREMQAYRECLEVALTYREEQTFLPISIPGATSNPTGVSFQIVRWLDWLTPYLYARLQRALGTTDDPIPTLCRQHAHVHITATHLDIYFSLAALPIEVRIAGLDRNPGWVPAAGRYVTFYFE